MILIYGFLRKNSMGLCLCVCVDREDGGAGSGGTGALLNLRGVGLNASLTG